MATQIETPQSQVMPKASLQEIFSSIQGEGIWVGKRQVFVRFNQCHLKCAYCDTPNKPASWQCMVQPLNFDESPMKLTNPLSISEVLDAIQTLIAQTPHHSVSLTGGEPLLYTDFLCQLLPTLSQWLPIYLETSGTQPEKFAEIAPWVTYVAMDIKLPSATGEPMQLENHQQFFELAQTHQLFVKLVFSEYTTPEELVAVPQIVTDKRIPIILQPVTHLETGKVMVSASKIFQLECFLSQFFADVRVIPQTHKMLDVL